MFTARAWSRCFVPAMVAALAAVGCAGQLRAPTPVEATIASSHWPGTTVADLERGRGLYLERCSSCHAVYRPEAYPAEKWQGFVEEMVDRAKLAPPQARDVIRYLAAAAESARNPAAAGTASGSFSGRLATRTTAPAANKP
jgi:mono/diheme cytochrome c family protein